MKTSLMPKINRLFIAFFVLCFSSSICLADLQLTARSNRVAADKFSTQSIWNITITSSLSQPETIFLEGQISDQDGRPVARISSTSFTINPGVVCAVLTADCLPVFVCKKDGSMVGIAHAGWKGLISGVIESLIESFHCNGADLVAHLGPAISKNYFEVGIEIKDLYLSKNSNFSRSFSFYRDKHYLDLYDAAKVILESLNITLTSGGDRCTFKESDVFFSYRRDGVNSGRMAHLIWIK